MLWINRLIRIFLAWTKRHSLPGFQKISIYDSMKFVYNQMWQDDITTRSNSAAFSFFLSLFPSMLFILALIPFLPLGVDLIEMLQDFLKGVLPGQTEEFLFGFLDDLFANCNRL